MLEINLHPFPTLQTERLVLREATIDDVNEFFFLRSDKETNKYIDKKLCQSLDEAAAHIERLQNLCNNNEGISWAISVKGNNNLIGNVGIWNFQKEHYRAEIGYSLNPSYHKRGIMSEAIKAAIQFGFDVLHLHSLEANVNPANKNSISLLEKIGFVREGYFKENYYYDGKFFDSAVYSLINKA